MAEEIVCETEAGFRHYCAWPTVAPGDSVTVGGITVVYRPPPPRDEAREAFEGWARDYDPTWEAYSCAYEHDRMLAAFLAGRASVKPRRFGFFAKALCPKCAHAFPVADDAEAKP